MAKSAAPIIIAAFAVGIGIAVANSTPASASTKQPTKPPTKQPPKQPQAQPQTPKVAKVPQTPAKSSSKAQAILPAATKWAKVFGTPLSLLLAIIENESAFNPKATNLKSPGDVARGGAWGLAQLTLKTAKGLTDANPKIAAKYWPKWDRTGPGLLDIETNLAMAAFGIGRNWARYKNRPNNWVTAGLAWNVGAGGVDKMLAKPNGTALVLAHRYAQHITAKRNNNILTAQVYNSEKPAFAFA